MRMKLLRKSTLLTKCEGGGDRKKVKMSYVFIICLCFCMYISMKLYLKAYKFFYGLIYAFYCKAMKKI